MWKQLARVSGNVPSSLRSTSSLASSTLSLSTLDISQAHAVSVLLHTRRSFTTKKRSSRGPPPDVKSKKQELPSVNSIPVENDHSQSLDTVHLDPALSSFLAHLKDPSQHSSASLTDVTTAMDRISNPRVLFSFLDQCLATGATLESDIFTTAGYTLQRHGTPADIILLMDKMKTSFITIPHIILVNLIRAYLDRDELFSALDSLDTVATKFGLLPSEDVLFRIIRYCHDLHLTAYHGHFDIPMDVIKSKKFSGMSVSEIAAKWKPLNTALSLLQKHTLRLPKHQQEKLYGKIIDGFMASKDITNAQLVLQYCKEKDIALGASVVEAIIRFHVQASDMAAAMKLFNNSFVGSMQPSARIIDCVIDGYLQVKDLHSAITFLSRLHRYSSYTISTSTLNVFLNYFANSGDFDAMRLTLSYFYNYQLPIDYGTVNNIIRALAPTHDPVRLRIFLDSLLAMGSVPPVSTYTTAIYTLGCMGAMDMAVQLLDEMTRVGRMPNVITYTTIIQGFCEQGRFIDAMQMKTTMVKNGVKPNHATYRMILRSATKMNEHMIMFYIIKEMRERALPVDLYTVHRCARLLHAQGRGHLTQQLAQLCNLPVATLLKPHVQGGTFVQGLPGRGDVADAHSTDRAASGKGRGKNAAAGKEIPGEAGAKRTRGKKGEIVGDATSTSSATSKRAGANRSDSNAISSMESADIPSDYSLEQSFGAQTGSMDLFERQYTGVNAVASKRGGKKGKQAIDVKGNGKDKKSGSFDMDTDMDKEILDTDDWLGIGISEEFSQRSYNTTGALTDFDLASLTGDVDSVFTSASTSTGMGTSDTGALHDWMANEDPIASQPYAIMDADDSGPVLHSPPTRFKSKPAYVDLRGSSSGLYRDRTGRLAEKFARANTSTAAPGSVKQMGEMLSADMESARQNKNIRKKSRTDWDNNNPM